jgi:hypothetical protein
MNPLSVESIVPNVAQKLKEVEWKVEEMTLEQVYAALGKKVKIV